MIRSFLILGGLLLVACPLRAVEFTIASPDKGEVWPKSSMVDRVLRWNEKKQTFVAETTFSMADYADSTTPAEKETYEFTLPGITYDPDQKLFFAQAPDGQKVAVAQRTKVFIGSRIDLCKVATIHVSRFKSELTLSLVVNTVPPLENSAQGGEDEVKPLTLDSLIKH